MQAYFLQCHPSWIRAPRAPFAEQNGCSPHLQRVCSANSSPCGLWHNEQLNGRRGKGSALGEHSQRLPGISTGTEGHGADQTDLVFAL